MKLRSIILFCIFFVSIAQADVSPFCESNTSTPDLDKIKEFDSLDCAVQKKILQKDEGLKRQYENKVYDILGNSLSKKITQAMEDFAILDQFFTHHKSEVLLENQEVKNKCRIQLMVEPECESPFKNERLNIIKSKFPDSEGQNTLFEKISTKAVSIRTPNVENNQCPLSGVSGYNLLRSQLTESEADKILSTFSQGHTNDSSGIDNNEKTRNALEAVSAQLRLLRNASEKNGNTENITTQFEEYAKKYSEDRKKTKVQYLNDFFLKHENQEKLAKGLASQCDSIAKNIRKFACEKIEHLGASDDFVDKFFYDEDHPDEKAAELQLAKGFSCQSKVESEKNTKESDVVKSENNLENWSRDLSPNVLVTYNNKSKKYLDLFCQTYTCKTEESKKIKSCENGGPATSFDIEKAFCDGKPTCTNEYEKYISFLKTYEDTKRIKESQATAISSTGSISVNSANGGKKPEKEQLSSFFQNLVGVKAAVVADGQAVTPETIKAKENYFKEKNLSLSSSSGSKSSAKDLKATKEEKKSEVVSITAEDAQKKQEEQAQAQARAQASQERASNLEMQNQFRARGEAEKQARELVARANKGYADSALSNNSESPVASYKPSTSAASTSAIAAKTAESSSKDDEIKKLQSDLASITNSIKGTDAQRLATIDANNKKLMDDKKAATAYNKEEEERLDEYRNNLRNWENRLSRDQAEFNSRRFSGRDDSSSNQRQGSNSQGGSSDSSGGSSGSSGGSGGSGVRLTKASASSGAAGAIGSADGAKSAERGVASDSADKDTAVTSEQLAKLDVNGVKNFKVKGEHSFIIKVKYKNTIYAIPVRVFSYNNKEVYVPLLTEKTKDLSEFIKKSPLFESYREYQRSMGKTE